jgi:hypothetical protein
MSVPTAGLPSLKNVYGFVNPLGLTSPNDSLKNYIVTAELIKVLPNDTAIVDTATDNVVGNIVLDTRTDTTGLFSFDVWPNDGLRPYTVWKFTVKRGSQTLWQRKIRLTGTTPLNIVE